MSLFQFGFTSQIRTARERQPVNTMPSHMPSFDESGLGRIEYDTVSGSTASDLADPSPAKKRRKRGNYTQYSPQQRASIGKYALENGNKRARMHYLCEFPDLKESTIRNFKKAYQEKLHQQRKQLHPQPVTEIPTAQRGRSPMLLDLDEKLIAFLKAIRARGGVININVVRAVAGSLIECNPSHQQLSKFSMPRSWVQSIYRRMGFVRRLATTGRQPVPSGLYKECRTTYLRDISEAIKKHKIPPELILNSDQTPSSYISVGKVTMAKKGSTSVAIKGVTDKCKITLTFIISLSGQFLLLQIIYGGMTNASHPRGFKFPEGFCISQNPKHWSNENETLKLIDEIINPYAIQKRQQLQLPETQKVLLIWDVFKGQMTEQVKQKLKSLNIELVAVPSNMTHFFQPLDLTVNGVAKRYMRKQFITYYSNCVKQQLENGKRLEDVEVDFRLTSIKPLHARWIVGMYNFLTSEKGSLVIKKGWEKAGITGLLDGSTEMPSEDPFEDL